MAMKSTFSLGGIVGLALGVLLVVVVAGTPLYISHLQNNSRALDDAVRDDVETLRRVVLNLNENLDLIQQTGRAAGPDAKPPSKAAADALAENAKLLSQAENVVKSLHEIRRGELSADGHLAVSEVKAILYLTVGKLHVNRANFEAVQAAELRRLAEQQVNAVVDLQRDVDAIEAQKPAAVIAKLQELLQKEEMSPPTKEIEELRGEIAAREKKITQLEKTAAENRKKLSQLEGKPWSAEDQQASLELSSKARAAEAEAESLRNGTLVGAKAVFPQGEDWSTATYEGGKIQKGLPLLRGELEALEEKAATQEKLKADILEQRKDIEERAKALDGEKSKILEKKGEQLKQVEDTLANAEQHAKAAAEARDQALAVLEKNALTAATVAITAAKDRTKNAKAALAEMGETQDECLKRISNDGETEAAADCLAADIAYNIAVVRLDQLNAAQAAYQSQVFIAKLTGGEEPADIAAQLEEIRNKAAAQLKLATDKFEEARKLVKGTNLRAPDGTTINGANYLWTLQVGEAAVRILEANLAGDHTARLDALKQADELLREAVKDREQSPLLTPAIETLQYLQRTTR